MTKVTVDPGICGFITTIEAFKVAKRRVNILITSDCEAVTRLGESLTEIDQLEIFKKHLDSEIYKGASRCQLHGACPVPAAILKAIEVEAELALPRDAAIRFETAEHR